MSNLADMIYQMSLKFDSFSGNKYLHLSFFEQVINSFF